MALVKRRHSDCSNRRFPTPPAVSPRLHVTRTRCRSSHGATIRYYETTRKLCRGDDRVCAYCVQVEHEPPVASARVPGVEALRCSQRPCTRRCVVHSMSKQTSMPKQLWLSSPLRAHRACRMSGVQPPRRLYHHAEGLSKKRHKFSTGASAEKRISSVLTRSPYVGMLIDCHGAL
jgi:hypothetical protein